MCRLGEGKQGRKKPRKKIGLYCGVRRLPAVCTEGLDRSASKHSQGEPGVKMLWAWLGHLPSLNLAFLVGLTGLGGPVTLLGVLARAEGDKDVHTCSGGGTG